MYDPIATERAYRDLVLRLSLPSAPRAHFFSLILFLKSVLPWRKENHSYILELDERLQTLIPSIRFEGTTPDEIVDAVRVMEEAGIDQHTTASVRTAAALQYAYVGETERAASALGISYAGPNPGSLTPFQRLCSVVEAGGPSTEGLRLVQDSWKEKLKVRPGSAVVPVVERSLAGGVELQLSALRVVTLKVHGLSKVPRDEVELDAAVFGTGQSTEGRLGRPLAAARCLIGETHPTLTRTYLSAQVRLDRSDALHEGASADLAIAALLYCAVLNEGGQRNLYNLTPDTAITGAIEESGRVIPIAASSVEAKVKAAFFSHISHLVIPASQVTSAEHAVADLSRQYPHKSLSVLGVGHLRDLFFDRRVTESRQTPALKHALNRTWHRRRPLAAAMFLALALTVGFLLYGPLDREPADFTLGAENLRILNKNGEVIDEIGVGKTTVKWGNPDNHLRGGLKVIVASLADLDGDANREIVWVRLMDPSEGGYTIVSAKKVRDDRFLWSDTLRFRFEFPNNPVATTAYEGRQVVTGDADGDGRVEVYAIAVSTSSFPSVILRLDGATGVRQGCYVHIGHLCDLELADLDTDGVKEVLACGMNNAFNAACLTILDPRSMDGHSPLTEHYKVDNLAAAPERAYVLVPRTTVGRTLGVGSRSNMAVDIILVPEERLFRFITHDMQTLVRGEFVTGWLEMEFGYDLRPGTFTPGDEYDLAYASLESQHLIPPRSRAEYWSEYSKTFLYWNGEGWTREPLLMKAAAR